MKFTMNWLLKKKRFSLTISDEHLLHKNFAHCINIFLPLSGALLATVDSARQEAGSGWGLDTPIHNHFHIIISLWGKINVAYFTRKIRFKSKNVLKCKNMTISIGTKELRRFLMIKIYLVSLIAAEKITFTYK